MKCWSTYRGLLLLSFAFLVAGPVSAQEKPAKEKPAPAKDAKEEPKADVPKKDAPAATSPATPATPATPGAPATPKAPAAPGDAAVPQGPVEEFNLKLTEWKDVLKELRTIRQKHLTAEAPLAKELEQQYAELIGKGDILIPQLRTIGMKAFAASKDDRNIERFLLQILGDDIAHDRYEDAAALSKSLLDSGCEDKKILDQAGVAAFCTNDFDGAEKYLKEAQNVGVIGEHGTNFLSIVPEYKEYWKTEQELRNKESQAKGEEQLPRIKVSTTKGDMIVELFENEAPGAVGNFISLIEKKFYDGLSFHRVLPAFMVQGGCPKGDGSGGPGYNIYCECQQPNHRKHFRGTLSMAHAGKDTGGSQFFITFVPTAHLNGRHTAFGRIVEGMEVLSRIQRVNPEEKDQHSEPDKILMMEVLHKRNHEYKPSKVQ